MTAELTGENPFHLFARYAEALDREFTSELEILSTREECLGIASKLEGFNLAVVAAAKFTPARRQKNNNERALEFEVIFDFVLVHCLPENPENPIPIGRAGAISKIRISERTEDPLPESKIFASDQEFFRSFGMKISRGETPAS